MPKAIILCDAAVSAGVEHDDGVGGDDRPLPLQSQLLESWQRQWDKQQQQPLPQGPNNYYHHYHVHYNHLQNVIDSMAQQVMKNQQQQPLLTSNEPVSNSNSDTKPKPKSSSNFNNNDKKPKPKRVGDLERKTDSTRIIK